MKRITIIGGGASGTLLALNLFIGRGESALEVNIVDKGESFGRGLAYATKCDCHLLNVPAAKMGAFASDPEHFYRWLRISNFSYESGDFVPRHIYGSYLSEMLAEAASRQGQNARLNVIDDEALDLLQTDKEIRVVLKSGKILNADNVVLATGNFPSAPPPLANISFTNSPKYFSNPWDPQIFRMIGTSDDVLIIGSGLTMVDVALGLHQAGHSGRLIALSTRGLLPAAHRHVRPISPLNGEVTSQNRLGALVKLLRKKIASVEAGGGDWRAVVDALRPLTQAAWLNLQTAEKRRFLRHLRRIWDVSRHRMPNECAAVIAALQSKGQLEVKRGRLREINAVSRDRLEIVYDSDGARHTLSADAVINCMGPETDLTKIDAPIIRALLERGTIVPDALKLGIDALPAGSVLDASGRASETIFALGPLLKGVLWETTAIPEIRTQAHQLAAVLLNSATSSSESGT